MKSNLIKGVRTAVTKLFGRYSHHALKFNCSLSNCHQTIPIIGYLKVRYYPNAAADY